MSRSANSWKRAWSAAGSACAAKSGEPKASPPTTIDDSDSVSTFRPLAPICMSMPLAFQKRVSAVTKVS
ncbi:hypothetical protein D9M73_141210 [compost metagenome]